jgi:Uma2 family endonuclease
VDSILQELIPGLLKAILMDIWQERNDWLFGIDLGFYYDLNRSPVAPDGMLCLGVRDYDNENLRPSYVLWEEKIIPMFTLEIVSKTPGGEWETKKKIYQSVGVLYYLVYAPLRKRKERFQLYKLIEGEYVLQSSGKSPYWMPEIGLGIGFERITHNNTEREWLAWYDETGIRYPTPMERIAAAERQAEAAERQAEAAERQAEAAERQAEAAERQVEIERSSREAAERQVEIERSSREAAEREIAILRQRLQELGE